MVAHDTVALAIIACLVGQFDERIRRVGRIDLGLYGKSLLTEMQRPGRIMSPSEVAAILEAGAPGLRARAS